MQSARKPVAWVLVGSCLGWGASALASSQLMDGLWRFVAGDPISAEEINANFVTIQTRLSDLDSAQRAYVNPAGGPHARYGLSGTYCGHSSTPHDGNVGGFRAVKQLCQLTCNDPAARQCHVEDIVRWGTTGGTFPASTPPQLWLDSSHRSYTPSERPLSGCNGWVDDTTNHAGIVWNTTADAGRPFGNLSDGLCDAQYAVACCN